MRRSYRFLLCPTDEQAAGLRQHAGVCRFIYNLALEQRRDWWRHYLANTGKRLNYITQGLQLTELRSQVDWIAAVTLSCQTQALRDLDTAFENFFSGRSRFPTPRKKGVNESFRFKGREISVRRLNARWAEVRLPKLGRVKFRLTRLIAGAIRNATVNLVADKWFIAFTSEIEPLACANSQLPAVAIDRGVATALALSSGELIAAPETFRDADRRRRKAQRVLARRKRGSKRYAKQRRRVARLHAKTGRIRREWLHRASTSIAQRFGTVALEGLRISNMTASAKGTPEAPGRNVRQKAGLNRAILEKGWGIFDQMLAYKLAERGGQLVKVDPAYTSQTCGECGAIDARSRKSQADFECVHCGHRDHADVNAAREILRRGNTALLLVEGARQRPDEARTIREAA